MLVIYIEQGFLDEFTKMPITKSYGVKFLWEIAKQEEGNIFIFDKLPFDKEKRTDLSEFTTNIVNGNVSAYSEAAVENAHLLFVTDQNQNKFKTFGMVFTLGDFEQRIEKYATNDNFVNFLEDKVSWNLLLFDFNEFPLRNLYIVDEYFFDHKDNTEFFEHIFNRDFSLSVPVTIYTNSKKVPNETGKTVEEKKIEKRNLIIELADSLKKNYNVKNVYINKTEASNRDSKYSVNWHDREIVSDYAMVVAGSGFKKNYKKRTNNKLVQFNIFTKNGRHLIREQKKKFEDFEEKIDGKYRLVKIKNW